MENLGLLDSMIAIASYRESLSYYSVPELVKQEKAFLESEDMYHPMLENPVANTIKEERGVLVTGSNASGKSTFLKTVAISAVLHRRSTPARQDSIAPAIFRFIHLWRSKIIFRGMRATTLWKSNL